MKVYLADLIHNLTPGGNVLTGKLDFTVPLTAGNISAYISKVFGDQVESRLFKYPDKLLAAIDHTPPAVLGLSNYAWNAHLNIRVADYVKKYYPHVLIVMGGPSIRPTPEDIERFLKRYRSLDAFVVPEGERPFVEILRYVMSHGPVLGPAADFKGVAYLSDDRLQYTAALSSELGDLADLPSPYLTGLMDEFLDADLIPLFESNRGCPFTCTFCAWGMASMNKVRKFPLDRILSELEYVGDRVPDLPVWIFADANFGILPRDLDIARTIRGIRARTALRKIITWDSKNTHERNSEIAQILGRYGSEQQMANTEYAYLAIQHLSEKVLREIKRANINLGNLGTVVAGHHGRGIRVTTDVLYVLPSETLDDAIGGIRACFDIKFDYVDIKRTLMLPGSEMETDASRAQYGLKTKAMIRRGSYGQYAARHETLRAMECDEVITSSNTFSEQDALVFHTLQWLVFYSWNHGRLRPLFRYLMEHGSVNPIDVLLQILRCDQALFPRVSALVENLRREIAAVMFETPEAMREHYFKDENWKSLLSYVRVELRYNAMLYSDGALHTELCDVVEHFLPGEDPVIPHLLAYIRENFVDLHAIANEEPCPEKRLRVAGSALPYIVKSNGHGCDNGELYAVTLSKSPQEQSVTRQFLLEHGYRTDPINAIERMLGARYTSALYDCHVDMPLPEESYLPGA